MPSLDVLHGPQALPSAQARLQQGLVERTYGSRRGALVRGGQRWPNVAGCRADVSCGEHWPLVKCTSARRRAEPTRPAPSPPLCGLQDGGAARGVMGASRIFGVVVTIEDSEVEVPGMPGDERVLRGAASYAAVSARVGWCSAPSGYAGPARCGSCVARLRQRS
jgi:hypothetical protein